MIKYLLMDLLDYLRDKRVLAVSAVVMVAVVGAVVVFVADPKTDPKETPVLSARSNSSESNTSIADGNDTGPPKDSSSSTSMSAPPAATQNAASPGVLAATPTTTVVSTSTVVKTTVNSDNTITKELVTTTPIPHSSQTVNEVNMKRGTTQLSQAGQNGVRTTVHSVKHDQNGNELSRTTLSDSITAQPIAQITKTGVSDFNLNVDTLEGTEFGEMCLPNEYDGMGDGCVGVPSNQHLSIVNISGTRFVSCVSSALGVCHNGSFNLASIIPLDTSNTFIYGGTTYRADPRAGGGMSELLTNATCVQYDLACGAW